MTIRHIALTILFTTYIATAYGFGIYIFGALAPEMTGDLSLTPQSIGLIASLAQGAMMIAAPLVGLAARRFSAPQVILALMTGISICLLASGFARSGIELGIPMIVLGGSAAAIWIPMAPHAHAAIAPRWRGFALGAISSGTSYGVFLNGLFIPPLVHHFGWRGVWIAAGSAALLLLIAGYILIGRRSAGTVTDHVAAEKDAGGWWKDRTAIIMIALNAATGLACMPFQTYLTIHFRSLPGWTMETATGLWSAIGFGGMLGGFLLGALSDRIGTRNATLVAYALLTIGIAAAAVFATEIPVYAALVVYGGAYNGVFGITAAYISKMFAPRAAAALLGVTFFALGFGGMAGNYAGGLLAALPSGFAILYPSVAVVALVTVGLSALLRPDRWRTD